MQADSAFSENGSGAAANTLGVMLQKGCKVPVDCMTAALFFEQPMPLVTPVGYSLPEGALNLGYMYEDGERVGQHDLSQTNVPCTVARLSCQKRKRRSCTRRRMNEGM